MGIAFLLAIPTTLLSDSGPVLYSASSPIPTPTQTHKRTLAQVTPYRPLHQRCEPTRREHRSPPTELHTRKQSQSSFNETSPGRVFFGQHFESIPHILSLIFLIRTHTSKLVPLPCFMKYLFPQVNLKQGGIVR